MSVYVYQCTRCSEVFMVLLRNPETDQLPACPNCHSTAIQPQLSEVDGLNQAGRSSTPAESCSTNGRFT
ncbi:MAG: zinc ribbon domain-containing protein [Chloroflexi bacterium]|jgi:putative FmdB family regulatory protein|nr:FmdB family zinc ribbon protein [Anaerolineaceae bacterium]NMB89742.1 zinc ribbon domain-containing protein [Chloroflexota bacterium]